MRPKMGLKASKMQRLCLKSIFLRMQRTNSIAKTADEAGREDDTEELETPDYQPSRLNMRRGESFLRSITLVFFILLFNEVVRQEFNL